MKRQSVLADKEKFELAAKSSNSIKEFLEKMGLRAAGGNFKFARKWAEIHKIELPVWVPDPTAMHLKNKIPDCDVFCENSLYVNRSHIKKRLLSLGVEYLCSMENCPNPRSSWRGRALNLQLDHINGVFNDNRLDNLRFLCPNCHSQTETFSGRNTPKKISTPAEKQPKPRPTKILWPSREEVLDLVVNHGYTKTGKILGVSDNSVRKFLQRTE